MAIKGGQIVHVGNNAVLLDRLQTAGPGTVNIRRETIYELGNYQSVGQVSDIPDLSFTMESFDVSCAMEALLADKDVKTTHEYELAASRVLNLKSAFKPGSGAPDEFGTVGSAAVPCLRLESVSYRYGVGNNNARQTATLKGDSLYYNPGSTYVQGAQGTNAAGQQVVLAHPAYAITESGAKRRTLAVTAGDRRLLIDADYTESAGAATNGAASTTVTIIDAVPTTDKIYVTYASPAEEVFPQSVHALVSGVFGTTTASASTGATTLSVDVELNAGDAIILDDVPGSTNTEVVVVATASANSVTLVNPTVNAHASGVSVAQYVPTVKPAAIRGRDIDVYIGVAGAAGSAPADVIGQKRHGVQSAQVDWKVTLQNDEEMGNYHYTNIDFDVPDVSGSVGFKPQTYADLLKLMQDISGVTDRLQSAGVTDAPLLDVQVVLKNPVDGRVLKRLHVPDARFSMPGYSGRVQQKLDFTANFQSDRGELHVYDY